MNKKSIKERLKKIISSYNQLIWDEITDNEKLHPNLISDGDIPHYRKDLFNQFSFDISESTELANNLIKKYNTVEKITEFIHNNTI